MAASRNAHVYSWLPEAASPVLSFIFLCETGIIQEVITCGRCVKRVIHIEVLRGNRMDIRYAAPEDKSFWYSVDTHLPEGEFDKKVRDNQGYVLFVDDQPVGLLRYNLFWDNTPFCTLIFIGRQYRKKGFGRSLMERWEQDMRTRGYGIVLTSTQVDEDAQHFYRKLGYKDCGGFTVDIPGYEQPMELFMVKRL